MLGGRCGCTGMSHYQRKWAFAHAQVWDENGDIWLAESRAGSGTWVIHEGGDSPPPHRDLIDSSHYQPSGLIGAFFPFHEDHTGVLLYMTPEQRAALAMPDAVYTEINDCLRASDRERTRARGAGSPAPPPVLSCLGSRSRAPGVLEGAEVEYRGVKLQREGDAWVVVGDSADEVDAAARARVSS